MKLRVTTNLKKCAVLVCEEDKEKNGGFQMEVARRGTSDRRRVNIPWRRDNEKSDMYGCIEGGYFERIPDN